MGTLQKAPESATRGQVREARPALAKIQALECLDDRRSVEVYMIGDYGNVAGCRLACSVTALVRKALGYWGRIDLIGRQRPSPRR
jgi:hypothetical protein